MGVTVLRSESFVGDPGPQPLKHASLNGAQLYRVASSWPEFKDGKIVGMYQALGEEKTQLVEATNDVIEAHQGFDGFKPAAMIFEHLPLGPFAHLAVGLGCLGPFVTLSGDELAAGMALTTALHDLQQDRCELALVGGYTRTPARIWLTLLARSPEPGLTWHSLYTNGVAKPLPEHLAQLADALGAPVRLLEPTDAEADSLGLMALANALRLARHGEPAAVWRCTTDGRGLLVGLGAHA